MFNWSTSSFLNYFICIVAIATITIVTTFSFRAVASEKPFTSTPTNFQQSAAEVVDDLPYELEMNIPEVLEEVQVAFAQYEEALTTNNIPILDQLFFNSPNTIRYGANEENIGYQAIQEFRKGRNPTNLVRQLVRTRITSYGRDFAVASTEFTRSSSPGKLGRQQQTWIRTNEGWKIVAAHVSSRDLK